MKLIAYNVRDDEIPFVKAWGEKNNVEVSYSIDTLNAETVKQAQGYDGISGLQTIPYDEALFSEMKEMGISMLALRNVGLDNVDLTAAKKAGIVVTNVPAYSPASIAEFAVTLALAVNRKVGYMYHQLHELGEFHFSPDFMGQLISNQTVGVVGTGRIGREAIRMFTGLGAKVIAYSQSHLDDSDLNFTYVDSLEELLDQADVIDLHIPGVPENEHLFDEKAFKHMKSSAILINTARGSIVDTQALICALEEGEIAGAGIDTLENESADLQNSRSTAQVTDSNVLKLAKMPNVIVTPHSAFHTDEAVMNMVNISFNNLKQQLTGGEVDNLAK
ncbi:D-2-hydroxyacid dehydrogenase [Lentilactobacillus sp. SPB1-3]|uniref:D-2-hydroxyacid dehydrogenase n=1 Tax=Lentilactobacillus terminaliae TaxID=3003483 RepID=A0ACD5DH06_9LACO|nr:D-2-hydroxyacid dehydrogenase [Lentilactobacillus sp. SPB1-3]MCZ0976908.1 D-2-hydroxyacid dehydrogenase [Lentilactobacillus sp. SPB1-3]